MKIHLETREGWRKIYHHDPAGGATERTYVVPFRQGLPLANWQMGEVIPPEAYDQRVFELVRSVEIMDHVNNRVTRERWYKER